MGNGIGDIAGSRFEGSRRGRKDVELFHHLCTYTDDTVCTAAVADIVPNDRNPDVTLQRWCRRHPGRGYGGYLQEWIASTVPAPYGSFGNGAAMRVAPVALLHRECPLEEAFATSDRVISKAGLPSSLINALRRIAGFQNPDFYQKQRLRLSTARIPRIICRAEDFPRHVALPRGCVPFSTSTARSRATLGETT